MNASANNMKPLNRDTIKYIAMFTMLLNHIAHVFLPTGSVLCEVFMDIGYFTAPTMCYFMAEGYEYTRSKRKYGLRLLIFAVISQIPYTLAFRFGNLNMIFTLFCCFMILVVMEQVRNPFARRILCVVLTLATVVSDWALLAPLFTVSFYNSRGDKTRIIRSYCVLGFLFVFFNQASYQAIPGYTTVRTIGFGLMSGVGIFMSAVVILCFYNGKLAERGRQFSKWFFYIFYPGHLLILYLIKNVILV